ncbi:S-adenosyl-L-methionine-dependent methyltransferase, partial [Dacryopinax primogenitus]
GVGSLTRALLEYPPSIIKRIIAIETHPPFLAQLSALARTDPRLHVLPASPYLWETYDELMSSSLLSDITPVPWEEEQTQLQFICRLPLTLISEQLMSQFLRFVPLKAWLFKYGRVPMGFLLPLGLWERLSAPTEVENRCKLSVITALTTHAHLSSPISLLQPYNSHFLPLPSAEDTRLALASPARAARDVRSPNKGKHIGHPYVAASFLPLREQHIPPSGLDTWDYITRMLFVQRSTAVKEGITNLGLGAKSLLKYLDFDTQMTPRQLRAREWTQVVDAFEDWPFRPNIYAVMEEGGDGHSTRRNLD